MMEKITLIHTPTDKMLADLLTKPLGGGKFRDFRSKLLHT